MSLLEIYTAEEYSSLPLRIALMLRAHVGDGKSFKAIAISFDASIGTVKSRISRARIRIKI